MKLHYQLNAAFTTLLLVILSVTGFVIYSLILNLLVQDEQRQLKQNGELIVSFLNEEFGTIQNFQQFSDFLEEQDLQLFVYDKQLNRVLDSTMSKNVENGFFINNNFTDEKESLWEYGNDKYVTSRIAFYPESRGLELILLTPLNDLQAVQHNFFVRLLIVFIVGTGAAVLLSYFLTNKLVTPLSRLKLQLKKIEKRQFDQIERINATGEIKEVEQSVVEMAEELQRYMKSQQAFFQNASHELKTPLMTIQGYAEGIRDHIFDKEDEEKGLEVMVTEVKRLKTIINEMILLAKLDSEQAVYQPEEIRVSELIDQVVDRALPLVNEKGISFVRDIDADLMLHADQEKLLRALLNITFNGIRHANSQVKIEAKKIDRTVFIVIADDGEGVPKDLVQHIFHRFVKGKNGETGLGLAIARAIVEQSGGKIAVEQSELGGAKFVLRFSRQ
ncbi:sensor histidine kinase [Virgibacillus oceani]|uniref:histidine kinase n=1 Tax=Virgibacillus oceani TaxID=1479511 RepID=A0A917HKX1_9BACI|nr:HAMP domain-containing sensor histidine kinase [Virgibacillus oceani]GGG81866.1 two-component sensor histidine kinase [Virgibacillus oceani]